MQKNSITNKITPCCGLPFSVVYWWVSNLTLNSESDRQFILSKISQNGILSIDGWKTLVNSGTLESDANLTKSDFLAWFDCGRQPSCTQLRTIIEAYKLNAEIPNYYLNREELESLITSQTVAIITPSTPFDDNVTVGFYEPKYSGKGDGLVYPNAGGLTAKDGYITRFFYDGEKWEKIETFAGSLKVDDALSLNSENSLQNKVITEELNKIKGGGINDESLVLSKLSSSLVDFISNSGNAGVIENFPDEITLTKKQTNGVSALQLKDRIGVDGLTYKRQFPNDVASVFFNSENTIFEINYNFNLAGLELTLPKNSILVFNGGSFYNGKINGNKTKIVAPKYHIFRDIELNDGFVADQSFPEWFGAVGDGVIDDFEALQKSINYFNITKLSNNTTYKINSAIDFDVSKKSIVGGIGVFLDFSSLNDTYSYAFQLYSSSQPPYYQRNVTFESINIKGKQRNGEITGLVFERGDLGNGEMSHLNFKNVNIFGFDILVSFYSEVYLISFAECDFFGCDTCVRFYAGGVNNGENISFYNCVFYNSDKAFYVEAGNSGVDFLLVGCSIDFCNYLFYKISRASVACLGCHFEYQHTVKNSFCNVEGAGAVLKITDSYFLMQNSNNQSTEQIGVVKDCYMSVKNSRFHNFGQGIDNFLIEQINSNCVTSNNDFFHESNMTAGLFSQPINNINNSFITSDTSEITTVYEGSNIVLTPLSRNEIKVKKTYGNGSQCNFVVYFDLSAGYKHLFISVKFNEGTAYNGNMYISKGLADILGVNNKNMPVLKEAKELGVDIVNLSNGVYDGKIMMKPIHDINYKIGFLFFNLDVAYLVNGNDGSILTVKVFGL